MKKKNFVFIIISVLIIMFIAMGVLNSGSLEKTNVYSCDTVNGVSSESDSEFVSRISTKLIRFHVIADSDSKEDQSLKLKIRDKILAYISPKLKSSSSLAESRKILKENDEEVKKIALKCISENGYNYGVKTTLDREDFPVKTYGNITLPQGNYEAYRVIIGSGKGKNWWCVMFPPLCFVDITKGQIAYDKNEKEMKRVLSDKDYKKINNEDKSNNKDKKIVYTFKIKEVIDNIVNMLEGNKQ